MRGLKRVVAAAVTGGRAEKDSAAGTAAATTIRPISVAGFWQRGFFDHLIRNTESYTQKWDYVRENPVRSGLVASSDAWKYQGEIALIDRV